MIPAVFQVTFAAIITGTIALLFEHPWTATPDAEAIFSILWLGILGSGLAYLAVFRLFAALGRDPDHARRLPHPRRRDRPRLPRPRRSRSTVGSSSGPRWSSPGSGLVNSKFGRRRLFGRHRRSRRSRSRPAARGAARPSAPDREQQRPADDQRPTPRSGATASERSLASPSLTEPQAAAKTVADSRSGATPDNGATLSATRMHRYAMSVSQPPTAARRAAAGP